jgi:preprotein translocase subunit YajC
MVVEEVGRTTRGFFSVMKENPLSLALVVVVFALAAMLYYSSKETLEQRTAMAKMIVEWQKEQQVILGGCVSADVTKGMMDNMQKITETMLTYNNAEIKRMQESLDKERDRSFNLRELRERELKQLIPTPEQPPAQRQNLRRSPVFKDIYNPDVLPFEQLKFPLHFEQLLQPLPPSKPLDKLEPPPPLELTQSPPETGEK